MKRTRKNLPGSFPPTDPAALQTLMCRAGLAVAVLDASGQLSMMSPGLETLLHRPFAIVSAESLAEVFHLYGEVGRLLERRIDQDEAAALLRRNVGAKRGPAVDREGFGAAIVA